MVDSHAQGTKANRPGLRAALLAGVAVVALGGGLPGASLTSQARAQGATVAPGSPERSAYDSAFAAMLADPGNIELAFRYAEAATRAGDFEGAIGALERILLLNPNVPRIRFELGVLYYRLGSYDAARGYLEEARAAPEMPANVRSQVDAYIADIDRRSSKFRFSGAVTAGGRYQSNANSVNSAGIGRTFGVDLPIADKSQKKKNDYNAFANLTGQGIYDFQNQAGDVFEVNSSLYGTRHSNLHRFELILFQLDAGPRFQLDAGSFKPTLRPYALVNYAMLSGYNYFGSYGFGVNSNTTLYERLFVDVNLESQERNYKDNSMRGYRISDQDGWIRQARGYARYALSETMGIAGISTFTRTRPENAGLHEYARNFQYQFGGIYDWTFASPVASLTPYLSRPWRLQTGLTRSWKHYDTADATIDSGIRRKDREWDATLGLTVGITEAVSGLIQLEHDKVNSNIPNYTYTNNSVVAGATYRF